MVQLKRCSRCQEERSIDWFVKSNQTKDGLNPWCRECRLAWRKANAEHIRERNRAYQQANREKVRAWGKAWRERNRERERERFRQKYEANPAYYKEQRRKWREANPEKVRAAERRRRERLVSSRPPTDSDWLAILKKHGFRCFYCGQHSAVLEQEHKIPISLGGKHVVSNVVPSCPTCNRRKGTKTDREFLAA